MTEKKLAISQEVKDDTARWMPVCGWSVPAHFWDPEAEYRAARESVALMPADFMTVVSGEGKDHVEYLNRRLSQRVIGMQVGDVLRANQLAGDGRMEADLEVLLTGEQSTLLLAPPAVPGAALAALMDKYVFSEDARFADVSDQWKALALFGPGAGAVCRHLGLLEPPAGRLETGTFGGHPCITTQSEFLPGAIVVLVHGQAITQAWVQALVEVTRAGGRALGFLPFDTLRVEAGAAWFGIDLNERSIPLEADLMSAIHTNKGCYPGQETIAKIMNLGHPARKLVGIAWESEDPPAGGSVLRAADKEAGTLTSSTFSPVLGRAIGLAMVKWPFRTEGTIIDGDGGLRGRVVKLPFGA